ncbi:Bifunctional epoxide hydrolase 2 [Linum perenne]
MDQIKHKFVEVNGSNLHLAEIGAGFRVIAPDHRGYGLSDPSLEPEKTKFADLIADLRSILDFLNIPKVAVVAKDFGVLPGYYFALLYPERVLGVVTLGVPFVPPGSIQYHKHLPEGFYFTRWKEPGRAEADFGRLDAKTVVRNVYILFSGSELPTAAENQEIMDLVDQSTPLPPWLSEEDLDVYGALYQKSGFRTALKMPYRSEVKVNVPALLIMGSKDYVLKFPTMEDYAKNTVKQFVPDLKTVFMAEGTHFVQEQLPEEVNQLILDFLRARIWP